MLHECLTLLNSKCNQVFSGCGVVNQQVIELLLLNVIDLTVIHGFGSTIPSLVQHDFIFTKACSLAEDSEGIIVLSV